MADGPDKTGALQRSPFDASPSSALSEKLEARGASRREPSGIYRRLLAFARHALSFETFFLLYLVAGAYGGTGRIPGVPIDLALLFGLISGAAGIAILRSRGSLTVPRGLIALGLFVLWAAASLLWTHLGTYPWAKITRMALYITWAYAGAALIIGRDEQRIRRFLILMIALAGAVALETLRVYFGSTGAHRVLGSSYLGVGRVIGLGCCAQLAFLNGNIGRRWKALAAAGFLIMGATMFVAGGRGPLLAMAAAVLLFLVASDRKTRLRVGVLGVLLIGLVVWAGSSFLPLTTVQRLQVLFTEEGGGKSASSRMELMGGAVEQIKQAPLIGQGIGSFYHHHGRSGVPRDYPHNIFLETGGELGIIGLALFLAFMALSLKGLDVSRIGASTPLLAGMMLLVFSFINAQFTGDIPDNRYLFTALGLLAAIITPHSGEQTEAAG